MEQKPSDVKREEIKEISLADIFKTLQAFSKDIEALRNDVKEEIVNLSNMVSKVAARTYVLEEAKDKKDREIPKKQMGKDRNWTVNHNTHFSHTVAKCINDPMLEDIYKEVDVFDSLDAKEEIEKFRSACWAGIERRRDLAENDGEREYLTKCIRYELGEEEKEGMREFARRGGLPDPEIEWV